jgi:hypothetical protein
MSIYVVKNAEGGVVNRIVASEDFMAANYDNYEPEVIEPSEEEKEYNAKQWRDHELSRTDTLMLLSDYPGKEALTTYRQALRDWPSTADFPDTKPVLGS